MADMFNFESLRSTSFDPSNRDGLTHAEFERSFDFDDFYRDLLKLAKPGREDSVNEVAISMWLSWESKHYDNPLAYAWTSLVRREIRAHTTERGSYSAEQVTGRDRVPAASGCPVKAVRGNVALHDNFDAAAASAPDADMPFTARHVQLIKSHCPGAASLLAATSRRELVQVVHGILGGGKSLDEVAEQGGYGDFSGRDAAELAAALREHAVGEVVLRAVTSRLASRKTPAIAEQLPHLAVALMLQLALPRIDESLLRDALALAIPGSSNPNTKHQHISRVGMALAAG